MRAGETYWRTERIASPSSHHWAPGEACHAHGNHESHCNIKNPAARIRVCCTTINVSTYHSTLSTIGGNFSKTTLWSYFWLYTTAVYGCNGALNGRHGQTNGITLSFHTNHDFFWNPTMVVSESGGAATRDCMTLDYTSRYRSFTCCYILVILLPHPSNTHCFSTQYIPEVLERVVVSYLQDLLVSMFQQDNAIPHVAHII